MKQFKTYPRHNIMAAATSDDKNYLSRILTYLRSAGIDTTKHRYELAANEYYGDRYTYKFTAPGDYIAYISMCIHRNMGTEGVAEFFDDYYGVPYPNPTPEEIEAIFQKYKVPTSLAAMARYAPENWWGDGSDQIIYLKNLDTGEFLYSSGYDESDEEEDDWDM